ncbi:MAG: hypothetical protein IKW74_03210, partial [Thermoguttaceae bacterium]|nr:hypothetical protein [Thermoguttaceae bacterium]
TNPFLPCVYDTWSEKYQVYCCNRNEATLNMDETMIPLNGKLSSEMLPDFPPPYQVALKGLQVEIRIFDPRSKNIRNITIEADLTKK